MPRGPRDNPPGWTVEIVTRTICGFFLLPATAYFARIFVGVLALAQKKYPVKIHAAVALSNHYHLIVTPADAEQLADFMEFFNGNLAREAKRLIGWQGRLWADRYHAVPISPEPGAMVDRLRYVISHSVKENLVTRISEWEGLHCAQALIDGKPMSGVWYERSVEYEAQRQAERRAARRDTDVEELDPSAFMTHYELKLAPMPCWQSVPTATNRKRVAKMVEEIEEAAARKREKSGVEPLGMERIRNQDPLTRPAKGKGESKPRPLCHAASDEMRDRVRRARRAFGEMFRAAAEKLKWGKIAEAIFPKNSFPPSLPFVRKGIAFDPLADIGGSPGLTNWAAAPS